MRKIKEMIEKMLIMSTEDLKKYCRKVEKNDLIEKDKLKRHVKLIIIISYYHSSICLQCVCPNLYAIRKYYR